MTFEELVDGVTDNTPLTQDQLDLMKITWNTSILTFSNMITACALTESTVGGLQVMLKTELEHLLVED